MGGCQNKSAWSSGAASLFVVERESERRIKALATMARGFDPEDLLLMAILDSEEESDWEEMYVAVEMERLEERRADQAARREGHGTRLDLEKLTASQCKEMFRFAKEDIYELRRCLRIPDELVGINRTRFSGLEGLCILLRRLAYPNRLVYIEKVFGRGVSELSVIVSHMLDFIYQRWHHLLDTLPVAWLTAQRLQEGAAAVFSRCPLNHVWGFVDGTARPISKPINGQRLFYSGHKRIHALKFQSVMTPFGIIAHLFGPVEGRRRDASMLEESGLLAQIEQHMCRPNGDPYVIYGDPAYPIRPQIIRPFQGAHIPQDEADFNKEMSEVRVCVEWGFGAIAKLFAFVDFKKNNKILLQPIGKYYIVAALLTNCEVCFYGNTTAAHFRLQPPSLAEYLQ